MHLPEEDNHTTPVSPVDFNLKKRDRQPFLRSTTSYTNSIQQKESKRSRWSDHDETRKAHSSTRIAQTLIMQGLDVANSSIQALLLELIATKELKIANVKYNVPKPSFLVIAVLPQGYNRLSILSQLVQ